MTRADRSRSLGARESSAHTGAVSYGTARDEFAAPAREASGAKTPRLAPWQERKAKTIMSEHLADPVDVEEIARSCGVSHGYFITAFCNCTGLTPHQWLIRSRLHRAQDLLLSSDLPIAEIALSCGFYDQSHFSHAFAHRAGLPPGRWRRERQGKFGANHP